MLEVKSTDIREEFEILFEKVFKGETLLIIRPQNENIVMISEKEYKQIMKVKRNEEYITLLDKSMAEAEAGEFVVKGIEDLEEYE
jgi:antitoxin YefM